MPEDKRAKLLHQVITLHNWLEEHCFDITPKQAIESLNSIGQVWEVLERRKR